MKKSDDLTGLIPSVNASENQMMTISEAARYQNVSRGTVDLWIRKKYLAYEQLPSSGQGLHRFIRIRKQDLDAMKENFHNNANTAPKSTTTKNSTITLLPKIKKPLDKKQPQE